VPPTDLAIGDVRSLIVDGAAHRGFCVARTDGRVVFVRGAIPGEQVQVQITRRGSKGRFWFGDVVRVEVPSPDRVAHPWPASAPVGGLELGHVSLEGARRWKGAVIQDQLRRLGRLAWPQVDVEAAPGDAQRGGLHWRTRVQLAVDSRGRAGMRRYRSHDVIPLQDLPIAVEAFEQLGIFARNWPAHSKLQIALPNASDPFIAVNGQPWPNPRGKAARKFVRERVRASVGQSVLEHEFRVAGTGFWQVHRVAPQLLAEAVLQAAGLEEGQRVVDLYAGAGLFSAFLAQVVGPTGTVIAIEADEEATRAARRNFHDYPHVEIRTADVLHTVAEGQLPTADVVVLDPPRAGAGAEVIRGMIATKPRKIVHVSCDPATFARDVATYYELGWEMASLRAFDIYPLTHHVETLAVFIPLVS